MNFHFVAAVVDQKISKSHEFFKFVIVFFLGLFIVEKFPIFIFNYSSVAINWLFISETILRLKYSKLKYKFITFLCLSCSSISIWFLRAGLSTGFQILVGKSLNHY